MDTMLSKALREFLSGPLNQLIVNLAGKDAELWEQELKRFLRKEACWSGSAQVATPTEPALDFIILILVDRSLRPAYPVWMKEVLHPELESSGPAEYDLSSEVEQWLHEEQKTGRVTGQVIYDHLKANGEIPLHLGLADLLAIQQKGITVFRKLFANRAVFGWKSVVRHRLGRLFVPYLDEFDGEVILRWPWLDFVWFSIFPALRFRK